MNHRIEEQESKLLLYSAHRFIWSHPIPLPFLFLHFNNYSPHLYTSNCLLSLSLSPSLPLGCLFLCSLLCFCTLHICIPQTVCSLFLCLLLSQSVVSFYVLFFVFVLSTSVYLRPSAVFFSVSFSPTLLSLSMFSSLFLSSLWAHLCVLGMLWIVLWHTPTELAVSFLFCSGVCFCLYALSTVFHSVNYPDNSPFSHSVLPVACLSCRSFQLPSCLWKCPSALI